MAGQKFYTREQVDNAKKTLADLPDLSADKITGSDVLSTLKMQIVELSNVKRYSAADIKSALDSVGIVVSERAIRDLLRTEKSVRQTRKSKKQN